MTSRLSSNVYFALATGALFAAPLAIHAVHAQDAEVQKALSGLPPEVLKHTRLTPPALSAPTFSAGEPLAIALYLSGRITGDEDVKNRMQYECGLQALRQGRNATARELAAQMTDYRAALLLLEIAEKEVRTDRPHALEMMKTAAGLVRLTKPWQADLVLARLCITGTMLEQDETLITTWWKAIRDDETRRMATIGALAWSAGKTGVFDLAALKAERERFGATKPMPRLLETARRLFDLALEQKKSADAADHQKARALVDAALEVLTLSNVVRAELLLDVAADFWKAGDQETSQELFEMAEKTFGAPHEEMARLNYKLVKLWHLRGRAEMMRPVLEEAEKKARELEPMYRPFAYSWLAAAWELAGDAPRAAALDLEAMQEAVSNDNPRTGMVGAIHLCLSHASTGRDLSKEVLELAEKWAQGSLTGQ